MTNQDFNLYWTAITSNTNPRCKYDVDNTMSIRNAKAHYSKPSRHAVIYTEDSSVKGAYFLEFTIESGKLRTCKCDYIICDLTQKHYIAKKLATHSQRTAWQMGFNTIEFFFLTSQKHFEKAIWERLGFIEKHSFNFSTDELCNKHSLCKLMVKKIDAPYMQFDRKSIGKFTKIH